MFTVYSSMKGRRVAQRLRCVFVDTGVLLDEEDESKEVILVVRPSLCGHTYIGVHSGFDSVRKKESPLPLSCSSSVAACIACVWLSALVCDPLMIASL